MNDLNWPSTRQVGESYKDYAARMAGAARAAELDRDRLSSQLAAVLALHRPTPTRFVRGPYPGEVGDQRYTVDCCAECEEAEYPCPTARALGCST